MGASNAPPHPCYVRVAGPFGAPRSIVLPSPSRPRRTFRAPVSDDEHPSCWRLIRDELRRAVPDSTWHQWLEPLNARRSQDGTILVDAPAELRPWVAKRYGRLLQACTASVLGPDAHVRLAAPGETLAELPEQRSHAGARGPETTFNPRHTFDQFVIGDSNRLAHAAALAVAEMPGLAYNPLFICGPPGLGKSHLLNSIANYVTAYSPDATIRYTTAEAFTNHFLGALRGDDVEVFKAAYRGVDVLLVDDVQFLQQKTKTEQEFFHTFNALHQAGAQIVLSSDCQPRDLGALELRLRERFEAGLVTDVRPPDPATRLAILQKRVQQDDIGTIDPAALEHIADRVTDNVRSLEGALVRAVAFGSLTGRPVTADLAGEVLAGLYPQLGKRSATLTVTDIQERTAEAFGISVDALLSTSRAGTVAWPRQLAMYLARELTAQSLPSIGRAFGGRNHTTVLHAYRRTAKRIAADPNAFEAVRRITQSLTSAQRPS
jgi:chromosomal replication initiator protein